MKKIDYYQILDIEKTTSDEEIKKAYRRLAFQYHPDQNPMDEEAEERFKKISEAYTVLGDPERRRIYDQYGYTGFKKHFASEDFSYSKSGFYSGRRNPFFFGGGCRKWARNWHRCSVNHDTTDNSWIYTIDISRDEALSGTERIIRARTQESDALYRLTIPAGIKSGTTLTLKSEDNSSCNLHVQVNVR
jgi:DnaJ-class molecular chaperone